MKATLELDEKPLDLVPGQVLAIALEIRRAQATQVREILLPIVDHPKPVWRASSCICTSNTALPKLPLVGGQRIGTRWVTGFKGVENIEFCIRKPLVQFL